MIFANRFLNTLFSVTTFPIWIVQGIIFKRIAIRLPEAEGIKDCGLPNYDFIMLGDSVAAGVGIEHISQALAGEIARELTEKNKSPVWKVMGKSGYKLTDLLSHLEEKSIPVAKHYVISIGVNDAKGFTSINAWNKQLNELINRLQQTSPDAKITLLEIPPMNKFPLLRKPLASVLGARCMELNSISHQLFEHVNKGNIIPIRLDDNVEHFAIDGFHPSNKACRLMAQEIIHFFD